MPELMSLKSIEEYTKVLRLCMQMHHYAHLSSNWSYDRTDAENRKDEITAQLLDTINEAGTVYITGG